MAKDTDPPRRPQPFLDILKAIKALEQSPPWQQQQAESSELRERLQQDLPNLERLRDMLSMPPGEAERWKALLASRSDLLEQIQQAYEQLQQEACESSAPAPKTVPTPEPAAERAVMKPVVKHTIEPAVDETAEQAAPIERKRPKQWAADWMQAHPRRKGEDATAYAQRMCNDMAEAPDVTEAWPIDTCRRELYRNRKETDFAPDPDSVQSFPKPH
jgi:hypothetical protein